MASRLIALIYIIFYSFNRSKGATGQCDNVTMLSTQIDTLLALQDREVPPEARVFVTVALDVGHASVSEGESSMRLLADLNIHWEDKRLTWNASEWNCSSWLTSVERLWLPDIVLLNAATTSTGDSSLRARISSDGSVFWIKRLEITTPISLRLEEWPRDTQTCSIVFGSRMFNSDELDLSINDTKVLVHEDSDAAANAPRRAQHCCLSAVQHALVFQTDPWEVMAVTGVSEVWSRGDVESLVVSWKISVQRHAPAHSLAASGVLAAMLLVLVAGTVLPPASRPPLAAAAALIGSVWMTGTVGRLPGATSSPRVLSLVCAACASAAVSCACSALVLRVPTWSATPPPCLRALLSKLSGWCDLTPHPEDSVGCEKSATWAATARLLDRVHLVALYLTIIIIAALYYL